MASYLRPGISGAPISAQAIGGGSFVETDIAGSAAILEAADTLSSTAVLPIVAAAAITEAADTLSAAALLLITGSATILEAADTASSAAVKMLRTILHMNSGGGEVIKAQSKTSGLPIRMRA